MHPDAGRTTLASLPVPPGATPEQVALGERIFHGEAAGGTCIGCHGSDAKGSPQAPSLVDGKWLQRDGSLARITQVITDGIAKPKDYSVPMPPRGRCAAVGFRSSGRRRLCLGDQSSGWQVKQPQEGRHDFLSSANRCWNVRR
jgi:hypothetical protein